MKYFLPILMAICILGCSKEQPSQGDELLILQGVIEKQGITFYQYGSHVLVGEGEVFALTNEKINMDFFVGNEVEIRGEFIKGYPVDGGPMYVKVLGISEL